MKIWGCKGFDGKLWWQRLRAEDANLPSLNLVSKLINAEAYKTAEELFANVKFFAGGYAVKTPVAVPLAA